MDLYFKLTFGFSLVCMIFWIIWLVQYPAIIWDSMRFRNDEGLLGHVMSVLTILFFLGFVNAIYLITKLVSQ